MRKLQTLCAAVVLALALVVPASAGVMSTGSPTPPPDSPTTDGVVSTPSATTDGVMSTGVASQNGTGSGETSAGVAVTGLALNLLQSVLSLA
jgi:hypothetical protein